MTMTGTSRNDVADAGRLNDLSPLVAPGETFESVTETIGSIVLQPRQPKAWIFGAAIAFALLMVLLCAVSWLLYRGVGIWGINIPVAWGFAIVHFVCWLVIGHPRTCTPRLVLF